MRKKFKRRSLGILKIRNAFIVYMLICSIIGIVNFLRFEAYGWVGIVCIYAVVVIFGANIIAQRKILKIEEDNHGSRNEYAGSGKTSQEK